MLAVKQQDQQKLSLTYISSTKPQASAALHRCKAQSKSDLGHNSNMRTMLRIRTGLIVPFLLLVATMFTGQIHATGEENDTKALQQVRKKLVQRYGSEDAGSVTDGSIASATMSESITASSVENSQAATKVTSSDQSSPNSPLPEHPLLLSQAVFRLLFPSLLWQSRQQTAPAPVVAASYFSPLYRPVPTTHVPATCRTLPKYVLSAWPTKKPSIVSTPF